MTRSGVAFAAIYLGVGVENYLVDVLAALAIAEFIRLGAPLAGPGRACGAYALE